MLVVSLASATASAAPPSAPAAPPAPSTPALSVVDPVVTPAPCRAAALLAGSANKNLALGSRVALAGCLADVQLRPLVLCDCGQSVSEIDDATARSLALLDEVSQVGLPEWQIVAQHAKGELLDALAVRMLATLPAPEPGASEDAIALHDTRAQLLRQLVAPWQSHAQDAFGEVDRIAKQNPELAKRPNLQAAVTDSERRLTAGVATR